MDGFSLRWLGKLMAKTVSIPWRGLVSTLTVADFRRAALRDGRAVPIWSVTASSRSFPMKIAAFVAALSLAVGGGMTSANAGCVTGAVVGGVAGHMAHHHTLVGAAAGCAIGHHMAVVAKRKKIAAAQAHAAYVAQHR
jgi:hypothetical protein